MADAILANGLMNGAGSSSLPSAGSTRTVSNCVYLDKSASVTCTHEFGSRPTAINYAVAYNTGSTQPTAPALDASTKYTAANGQTITITNQMGGGIMTILVTYTNTGLQLLITNSYPAGMLCAVYEITVYF